MAPVSPVPDAHVVDEDVDPGELPDHLAGDGLAVRFGGDVGSSTPAVPPSASIMAAVSSADARSRVHAQHRGPVAGQQEGAGPAISADRRGRGRPAPMTTATRPSSSAALLTSATLAPRRRGSTPERVEGHGHQHVLALTVNNRSISCWPSKRVARHQARRRCRGRPPARQRPEQQRAHWRTIRLGWASVRRATSGGVSPTRSPMIVCWPNSGSAVAAPPGPQDQQLAGRGRPACSSTARGHRRPATA